ncbi:MAG: CatB-related O-acetyltransferase [Sphingobium sp.]|nr:CatB-related O-acetyltransferase [Sphingobium sp.]MBP6111871.1 CatB-related O-acetyltransferase [Sphingobium sp.]MBP8669813.1 CatB-related O-acetyltransferase [Sphingobium sp.]MBP9156427.1 CatB-related O-acetyltransferase [Sphingobium sp.]
MLASLVEKIRVKLWLRNQHVNGRLRTYFRDRFRIDVGHYSYGCFDRWRMPGPIRVGRYCSIANTVRSAPINHPFDAMTTHPALYERKFGVVDQDIFYDDVLVIEDDVWIGHNVMILPGCKHVGRGAVIGAGAVVTKNVPAYAIVAGNPAKKLRDRFAPDLIAALEQSRWWELDPPELRRLVSANRELVFHPTASSVQQWAGSGRRADWAGTKQ